MDQKAIVEIVFKSVVQTLPEELGALLGQDLKCSAASCKLVSKEQLFADRSRPKSTLAHLKVVGDQEGDAFLILPTKIAIVFGGTLIMLPQDQIDENAANETLDGEVADAYGEVANIIAGVLTQIFLDKYPKSLRYVRTEVEELIDSKVDIPSDKPFPVGQYFHVSSELSMGGVPLGPLEIITPAALLNLESAEPGAKSVSAAPVAEEKTAAPAASKEITQPGTAPSESPPRKAFADAKKIADVVLKATIKQVAEELSALLGQTLVCSDLKLEMVTKAEFFENYCQDKSILTHMEVSGNTKGRMYLLSQTRDAIMMGGTLIMLPDDEIQTQMGAWFFEGEVADAYGELANIISGGLTQSFQDRFPQPLRFVKKNYEAIIPTKVDLAGETPFPAGLYYLASCATSLQGDPLDRLHLLFPAEILGIDAEQVEVAAQAASSGVSPTKAAQTPVSGVTKVPPVQARQAPAPPPEAKPVILVITDESTQAETIRANLQHDTYEIKVIGYKDDLRAVFSTHPVLGVFLLMSEVGEKGFSVAIKLQSCGYSLPPLIAGGPEWTRSAVLRAVKYGARDILVTPASAEEIRTKASEHIPLPV